MGSLIQDQEQTSEWATSATLARLPSGIGTAVKGGYNGICRQSSIYALTLDEFQDALGGPGKSFESMNMEDFLKTIWTAEESEAMAAAVGEKASIGGSSEGLDGNDPHLVSWQQCSLPRQASMSLPRTLSSKTVDDVWRDISWKSTENSGANMLPGGQGRQVTFREMTLEDFLVKAGIIQQDNCQQTVGHFDEQDGFERGFTGRKMFGGTDKGIEEITFNNGRAADRVLPVSSSITPPIGMTIDEPMQLELSHCTSSQVQRTPQIGSCPPQSSMVHHSLFPQSQRTVLDSANLQLPESGNLMPVMNPIGGFSTELGVGTVRGLAGVSISPASLALKALSPSNPTSDGQGGLSIIPPLPYRFDGLARGQKRGFEGPLEKVVERRQKRMIKNRESAARSRARKQAYTVELETEVSQLKEENIRLRKQEELVAEQCRKQFFDVMTSISPYVTQKALHLRRTRTGPW